jgi:hypothetical protein
MRGIVCRSSRPAALAIVCAALGAACGGSRDAEVGEFVLNANLAGTTVSTLSVVVTAPDIATPLAFNIQQQNGTATGTLRLPPGDARLITVQAFDTLGQLTHEGSKTVNVVPGQNPPVSIPVISRAGQVLITAVLGPVAITVTPLPAAMIVHETAQLRATIIAPNGDVLPGPVEWATTNPTIATVDQAGNVEIVGGGLVQIVATYSGVAAATQTKAPTLLDSMPYATWDGQPFSASLFIQNGIVVFRHRSPNDPAFLKDDPVLNYLSPGGPGSTPWQSRVEAAPTGGYRFQHFRAFGDGCSQTAPCFDHADFFIAFQGWSGEQLLGSIADIGGQLKFSLRTR